jgi:hypothetical protein
MANLGKIATGGQVPFFSQRGFKIIMIGGALIGAYVLYRALSGFVSQQSGRQETQSASDELDRLNQNSATRQKLSNYQAEQLSNKLFTAMNGWQTDESAIYGVMYQLKNNADFLAVSKAFGIRTISSGQFNPTKNHKGTMTQCLNDELDSGERFKVNNILKAKKIKYRI